MEANAAQRLGYSKYYMDSLVASPRKHDATRKAFQKALDDVSRSLNALTDLRSVS
jgi:hypothetical protein